MRGLFILIIMVLANVAHGAVCAQTRFVAVAFHDVVDRREDRADDAVTTESLISFLDFLVAEGWTAVSLQQVAAAGAGGPALPAKSVLLTFDDGYRSVFDRVYPLLLAYRMPAVVALVTAWMDVPVGARVDYGGKSLAREAFLTWDEVRRMQASGLVEIASHSHDLHRVVLMNREGNTAPAARTWAFDPVTGRAESDAAHQARIRADLARSRARIASETGQPPRALVWPYGRFSGLAQAAASQAGFTMALTLEPEAADAREPMALHRYYPTHDPDLGTIMFNLRFAPARAETVRLACLDPAPLAASGDLAVRDQVLGQMIEQVRLLGATAVVLPLTSADGRAFETPLLGRMARQLGTRAGVEVLVGLDRPTLDRLGQDDAAKLLAAAARAAPIDGVVLPDDNSVLAPAPAISPTPADRRAARSVSGHPVAQLFAAAAGIDPRLKLIVAGPGTPSPLADRQLLPEPLPLLAGLGWRAPDHSGRIVETLSDRPTELRRQLTKLQQQGASGFAVCPWNGADASVLAPVFSASRFPWLP